MGRGGNEIPKRYLRECPVCKSSFKGKYLNRIYCSSECRIKAFLEKYPNYHSRYYSKYSNRWLTYKNRNWKGGRIIIKNDHSGTEKGDIRSKKESESWDDYLKYFKRKKSFILEQK